MIFAVDGILNDVIPYAGATGIVGVVAFALKLLVDFQRDFTNRYAGEVRRQDGEIVALRTEVASLNRALDGERAAHRACEQSLDRQGRLLESLQVRLETLDRRHYPRAPEDPPSPPAPSTS